MSEVDADGSGYIDYSEFLMAALRKETLLNRDYLENAFNIFDKDGSGTITAEELRDVLGEHLNADISVWEHLIMEVDSNGNGEIDISEFKEMMIKCF